MTSVLIRPMTAADAAPAADLLDRGDWGPREARRSFFAFATQQPVCRPIVAEIDGVLAGTGVGTASGGVGWVGTIFVDRQHRGGGLGRRLTAAVIDDLEARGCQTLVLVATDLGRPIYERLGFTEQGWYETYEAPGLAPDAAPIQGTDAGAIVPIHPGDLPAMAALDALATGEDRSALLSGVLDAAGADAGWILRPGPRAVTPAGDDLAAFLLRPPWGGGVTIARTPSAALELLDHRRRQVGPERRVRAGVLSVNAEGAARLRAAGWRAGWRAVRMTRGARMTWRPEMIWGQFNFAVG